MTSSPDTVISHHGQEAELFRRFAKTRSPRLRGELVERFIPLARSLALRYRSNAEPLDDLMQVAALGLVKAVNRFDPSLGKSFSSYAVPTILGELRRHFRDRVWNLRLPRGLQELAMEIERATETLTESFGRFPTVAELADYLDLPVEDVLEGLEAGTARHTGSLDGPHPSQNGEPRALIETLGAGDLGFDRVEAEYAGSASGLTDRELQILRLRFNEELTQREIAKQLGCSQMQISRESRAALWKLLCAVRGDSATELPAGTLLKVA
jgi:RNA polymerase sigma-B factor